MTEDDCDSEFGDFPELDLHDKDTHFDNPVHELLVNLPQLIPQMLNQVSAHLQQKKRSKNVTTQPYEQTKRHRISVPVYAPSVVYFLPTESIEKVLKGVDTSLFLELNN